VLRSAERVWPPSVARGSVAVPNGEGVASGGATQNLKNNFLAITKNFDKISMVFI